MMVVSELVAGLIFLQFALAGADTVSPDPIIHGWGFGG